MFRIIRCVVFVCLQNSFFPQFVGAYAHYGRPSHYKIVCKGTGLPQAGHRHKQILQLRGLETWFDDKWTEQSGYHWSMKSLLTSLYTYFKEEGFWWFVPSVILTGARDGALASGDNAMDAD